VTEIQGAIIHRVTAVILMILAHHVISRVMIIMISLLAAKTALMIIHARPQNVRGALDPLPG
jgi:succinate dehydrogenase/fumarate reductase cytochrome b subunit